MAANDHPHHLNIANAQVAHGSAYTSYHYHTNMDRCAQAWGDHELLGLIVG